MTARFTITCSDTDADRVAVALWAMPGRLGVDLSITAAHTPTYVTYDEHGNATLHDSEGDVVAIGKIHRKES